MPKLAITGLFAFIVLALTTPAQAGHRYYHRHRHVTTHHFAHYLTRQHYRRVHFARNQRYPTAGGKPGCFWVAASMGGPCGCWAAAMLLGIEAHVWHGVNLWLAQDWADRFPHVQPEEANAVVWPHRHVAPVMPGTYDGHSIVVRDSWATHRVRTAGLVFVRAPDRTPKLEGIKWKSGSLG